MFFDSVGNWYAPENDDESNHPEEDRVFGSLRDYYEHQSGGEVVVRGEVVNNELPDGTPEWITMGNTRNYYQSHYTIEDDAIEEAKMLGLLPGNASSMCDLGGVYDGVVVVYAGNYIGGGGLHPRPTGCGWIMGEQYNNKFSHIGVHSHEAGHDFFGWPDLYHQTDHAEYFGLMTTGGHNGPGKNKSCPSSVEPGLRIAADWSTASTILDDACDFVVQYDYDNPIYYKVEPINNPNQYFILENRGREGFDKWTPWYDNFNYQGGTLLIWINHGRKIIYADGDGTLSPESWVGDFFPTTGLITQDLNDLTDPSSNLSGGVYSHIALQNIYWDDENILTNIDVHLNSWSGSITGNATWNQTVYVYDNLTVESGATLTIEPSTNVVISKSKQINVLGTLNAVGNSEDPIEFNSELTGSSNRWNGITVYDNGEVILREVDIINALYGTYGYHSTCDIDVSYCNFIDCYYGIYLRYNDDDDIKNCTFTNNTCGILTLFSDCSIEYNTFTNGYYGILSYYSDNIIRGNDISNNSIGIYVLNSNPSINGNEIDSSTSYGIYVTNSSGPELISIRYYGTNDVNNYIHHNNYGVYSSYNSFPNLGIFYDSVPLRWGGFNLFKFNTANGVKNTNTTHTLMAEANWWRDEPGNFGNVDVSPNADEALGMGPGSLPKSMDSSSYLSDILISAQILEMDSSYSEAITKYDSVISIGFQHDIAGIALIGIERCYNKLGDGNGLIDYLNNVQREYDNEPIGTRALYSLAGLYAKLGEINTAINYLEEVISIYESTPGAQEQTAWALFDLAQVYELLTESDSTVNKERAEFYLKAQDYYNVVTSKYSNTDAAELLHELFGKQIIAIENTRIPDQYYVYHNYPNPFNPVTTITFDLPEISNVSLVIYDLLGREVVRIVDTQLNAGIHTKIWDGKDSRSVPVSTGVYICRLSAASKESNQQYTQSQKMVLLK